MLKCQKQFFFRFIKKFLSWIIEDYTFQSNYVIKHHFIRTLWSMLLLSTREISQSLYLLLFHFYRFFNFRSCSIQFNTWKCNGTIYKEKKHTYNILCTQLLQFNIWILSYFFFGFVWVLLFMIFGNFLVSFVILYLLYCSIILFSFLYIIN